MDFEDGKTTLELVMQWDQFQSKNFRKVWIFLRFPSDWGLSVLYNCFLKNILEIHLSHMSPMEFFYKISKINLFQQKCARHWNNCLISFKSKAYMYSICTTHVKTARKAQKDTIRTRCNNLFHNTGYFCSATFVFESIL